MSSRSKGENSGIALPASNEFSTVDLKFFNKSLTSYTFLSTIYLKNGAKFSNTLSSISSNQLSTLIPL